MSVFLFFCPPVFFICLSFFVLSAVCSLKFNALEKLCLCGFLSDYFVCKRLLGNPNTAQVLKCVCSIYLGALEPYSTFICQSKLFVVLSYSLIIETAVTTHWNSEPNFSRIVVSTRTPERVRLYCLFAYSSLFLDSDFYPGK